MPKPTEPDILFEDAHLIVLSKPAGLLSQGDSSGEESLVDWLRKHVGRNYVGLIHRLDRNTSGVMVVAKRSKAAERLTRALIEGAITRTYLGWVEGSVPGEVRWQHRLVKDEAKNEVRALRPGSQDEPGAKEAVLTARSIRSGAWRGREVTLLEFCLETGRSHQIRVQAATEGHPLLGDRKYAHGKPADFPRPALHSHRLEFPHPMTGERMRFEAPMPADLAAVDGERAGSSP